MMMRAAKMMDESAASPEFAGGETRITVNVSAPSNYKP
jgi:hypothetical protein